MEFLKMFSLEHERTRIPTKLLESISSKTGIKKRFSHFIRAALKMANLDAMFQLVSPQEYKEEVTCIL
jgi:hypothetical protein